MSEDFKDFFSNSILKFESMLKSNKFLFFDVDEFESIIIYYLESGNTSLANKAIKMASKQYPENSAISSNTAKFFPTKLSLKSKSSGGYPVNESSGNKTISEDIFSASSNLLRIFSLFSWIAPTEKDS